MGLDEAVNALDELLDAGKRASTDGSAGDDAKPDLDLVEPGGIGWGEMEVEARVAGHPRTNFRVFVGGVVVDDQMNIEVAGDVGVDVTQELQELLVAVTFFALGQDLAGGDV